MQPGDQVSGDLVRWRPGAAAGQEPPSYEVLAALVASLRGELARAQERIAELEDRLRKTSRNSSMPPSGEGLAKPPPRSRSLRKKTGRQPGGQDGHPGTTLAQVAKPDREVRHEHGSCSGCGADLAGRPVTGIERRQVFDLPPVTVTVTEHQLIERECRCGHRTRGAAPQGAQAPVQYGPRVAAVIIYLYIGQFLSRKRTAQALAELFGIPLSPGTVAGITARAAQTLDGFLEHVRENITASDVAGFDETGFRVEGRLHWVHCARTGKYTLLMVHPRRGRQAMEAMGGPAVFHRDRRPRRLGPYDTYTPAGHQLCCAHALRVLQAVTDSAPAGRWCRAAPGRRCAHRNAGAGQRGDRRGPRSRGPGRAGGADSPLPLRRPARRTPDRSPQRHTNEKTPRPGPPAARPPG